MHKPLLCRLLGHKVTSRDVFPDGSVWVWCEREKRLVQTFTGWDNLSGPQT